MESVSKFNFLGSLIIKDGGCSQEIRHRLAMARSAMTSMSKIWAGRGITRTTKVRLVQALIFPIALYASETWTLNKARKTKLIATELLLLRCGAGGACFASWTMRRTNASILEEIGLSKRLLHTINIQMLSYFDHIARRKGNNLEKVVCKAWLKEREGKDDIGLDGSTK